MFDAGFAAEPDELAVAAASHSGEPIHLEVVRRILANAGLDEDALGNTPALPLAPRRRRGRAPRRRAGRRRCCRTAAASTPQCCRRPSPTAGTSTSYLEFEHPVQKVIDTYIAEAAGGVSHTGIDGCGAPTAMVTLTGLALGDPLVGDPAGRPSTRRCVSIPQLVAGSGREDTAADERRARTDRQGRRRRGPRRRPSRRPGGRRQGGRRFRAGPGAGDARRPAVARVRRRRRPGAVDPRPRPPRRRGPVGESSLPDLGGLRTLVAVGRQRHHTTKRRRVRGVADPLELRRAALQVRLHALLEVGAAEAARPSAVRRRCSAAPRPRWRSRYTCRFITAIDAGEQCSARSTT